MAARLIPGIPKSVNISKLKFIDIGAQRRRRAAIAFVTGSVLFVTSAAAMISDGASAQGGGQNFFSGMFAPPAVSVENFTPYIQSRTNPPFLQSSPYARRQFGAASPGRSSKRNKTHVAANRKPAPYSVATNYTSQRPVCVRLCDGFFFPASMPAGGNNASSEEAACSGLCPDAPTAVFYQPSGSDRIEDAFSLSGKRYTDLPIALRYRSTQDNTCSCNRSIASAFDPLRDSTLRKGDAVMTPKGFLVFRGVEQATHTRADFAALDAAPLPNDQRTTLRALERVSQAPQPGVTRSWVTAATLAPAVTEPVTSELVDKIRFVER
jgi:hypothetical protein